MSARWTPTATWREPRVSSCPTAPGSRSFITARCFPTRPRSTSPAIWWSRSRGCRSAATIPGGGTTRHSGSARCAEPDPAAAVATTAERRRRRSEPFLTLLRAIIHGAKGVGATHLLGATDAALHRWLVHFGFPYRSGWPGGGLLRLRRTSHHEHVRARSGHPQRTISRARWLPGRSGTGRRPAYGRPRSRPARPQSEDPMIPGTAGDVTAPAPGFGSEAPVRGLGCQRKFRHVPGERSVASGAGFNRGETARRRAFEQAWH